MSQHVTRLELGALLSRLLARPLLLAAWCLVGWGTLLDLAFGWQAVERGLPTAAERFGGLSLANQALAVLAAAVWVTAAGLAVRAWRRAQMPHPPA